MAALSILNLADLGNHLWGDCNKVRRNALRLLGDPALLALSECWFFNGNEGITKQLKENLAGGFKELKIAPVSNSKVRESLEKFPGIEFVTFASDYDFYTPSAIMQKAASEIGPRVKLVKLHNTGHEAYFSEDMLQELIPAMKERQKRPGAEAQ